MRPLRFVLTLGVIALVGLPALGQDKDKVKRKSKGPGQNQAVSQFFAFPPEIKLTDEQKKELEPIVKEFTPKITALFSARDEIMTPEQRRARRDAQKAAKDAGLKGKELRESVDKATNLSDEQKEKLAEVEKKIEALRSEVNKKKMSILTDEQKAKMPMKKAAKKEKKNKPA